MKSHDEHTLSNAMAADSQELFETCYRSRQGWLHHSSYMRMAKVMLALRALRRAGVGLEGQRVFDYGFGAGTFFRYCPRDAALFGVEQDPVVVEEVAGMLRGRGYGAVDLRAISIPEWREHPLLAERYDVFFMQSCAGAFGAAGGVFEGGEGRRSRQKLGDGSQEIGGLKAEIFNHNQAPGRVLGRLPKAARRVRRVGTSESNGLG
jgi:hypothetical protein